ncbi:signal peptide peptidase SppA [Amylibacter sp. IMCC11727]|uniref:signal peptide peptidase SppA n=1 Tax=Amylibacter sp. IMCC11727 TaxID=3039851 RepID=UPI00244E01CD|nr:signal peptide peptidase SppA [Amylibacter sp. IMCC11727]WGI21541.1 signal peptide peptidase SppA [Amylibacter sp. IMCC11727]
MDALERDFYEERRRKWRRSAFWRGVFVTIGFIVLLGVIGAFFGGGPRFGDHIAHVKIRGVIYDDPILDAALKKVEENDNAKALILSISSPGGTTVGSEAVYERLRKISKKKPVVSVLGEVAASGGYIAAIGTDHIIARGNTITGSIGVIMEYPDVTDLLTKIGVTMQTIRSSEVKGGPSPFRKPTEASIAAEKALIDESYQWFRALVEERRGLSGAALDNVADGRVFTGRLALDLKLIDAIGGFDAAKEYLDSLESVEAELPVDTYELEYEEGGFFGPVGKFLLKNGNLERISGQTGPRLYSIAK